jgi:hypothetical protein
MSHLATMNAPTLQGVTKTIHATLIDIREYNSSVAAGETLCRIRQHQYQQLRQQEQQAQAQQHQYSVQPSPLSAGVSPLSVTPPRQSSYAQQQVQHHYALHSAERASQSFSPSA